MKYLLALLIFIPNVLWSQKDYQCLLPEHIAFYEPDTILSWDYLNYIRGVKLTLDTESDTILTYANYQEPHDVNYSRYYYDEDYCIYADMDSWIGSGISIIENGQNVFYNRDLLPIIIKTDAKLYEKWEFFDCNDGDYFQAQVIKHDTLTFLGVTDSVKVICIKMLDVNGEFVDNPSVEVFEIILSKAYGLINTINYRDFPKFEEQSFQIQNHLLVGLSKDKLGLQAFTKRMVFDFEVGDEIHYARNFGSNYGSYDDDQIYKYIQKEIYGSDSVVYAIGKTEFGDYYNGEELISFLRHDTIRQIVVNPDSPITIKMPYESVVDTSYSSFELYYYRNYYDTRLNTYILEQTRPSLDFTLWDEIDSCFKSFLPLDATYWKTRFIEGLGEIKDFYQYESGHDYSITKDIVYYKKNGIEWGTPLIYVGVKEYEFNELDVRIVPNPSNGEIQILYQNNFDNYKFDLQIFNAIGQLAFEAENLANSSSVDISKCKSGIYTYILKSIDKKRIKRGKLIIK